MDEKELKIEPVFVTFVELRDALAMLHMNQTAWLDRLHDVWKAGSPSPQSIVRNPVGYDPRKVQPGNYETRLLLPTKLAEWIVDCSKARGMPMTIKQATNMVFGEADYGHDQTG